VWGLIGKESMGRLARRREKVSYPFTPNEKEKEGVKKKGYWGSARPQAKPHGDQRPEQDTRWLLASF